MWTLDFDFLVDFLKYQKKKGIELNTAISLVSKM